MNRIKIIPCAGIAARSPLHVLLMAIISSLLAALCASPALAADGRDFAGFYRYEKTADLPSGMKQVTLSLRLFNYSGADLTGAALVLENRLPLGATLGSVGGVSIDDGADAVVSGSFTVPDAEFQRWRSGGAPQFVLEYFDDEGDKVQRPVELIPAFGGVLP